MIGRLPGSVRDRINAAIPESIELGPRVQEALWWEERDPCSTVLMRGSVAVLIGRGLISPDSTTRAL